MESHDAEFSKAGQGWARKPSRFHATPREIDEFLRFHFAEDTLLRYQQAVGNRAVTEAAVDVRSDTNLRQLEAEHQLAEYGRELADLIDPMKSGGHYPSALINLTPKENRPMPHDYEQIANDIAGPDAREALRITADALHRGESMHMHDNISDVEPCSYCWLRAGRALRALREFSGHSAIAAKAEPTEDDELKASEVIW